MFLYRYLMCFAALHIFPFHPLLLFSRQNLFCVKIKLAWLNNNIGKTSYVFFTPNLFFLPHWVGTSTDSVASNYVHYIHVGIVETKYFFDMMFFFRQIRITALDLCFVCGIIKKIALVAGLGLFERRQLCFSWRNMYKKRFFYEMSMT